MTACLTGRCSGPPAAAAELGREAAFMWCEAQEREAQRRIDAVIAQASAYLMSDAKWRKLLGALSDIRVGMLHWRFLRDERIFVAPPPPRSAVLERGLGVVLPYPKSGVSG